MFGAAPMSAELQLRIAARMGCVVMQGSGLTETSPVTHMDFVDARAKPGSIGPPLGDVEQRVVDMETGTRDLGSDELGELLLRGPNIMPGYYNQPEATADAIDEDGWFHSGDLVKIDIDGYVYVLDRKKELIKYSGFQVPPAELEGILLEHPAVADAAVIGKADLEHGEIPKAFVVLKADAQATDGELMAYVAQQVATFKQVREIEFVDAIPKNASGKLLRRVLVEQERAKGG
jgi:long-chain acyl-CoA synthetase